MNRSDVLKEIQKNVVKLSAVHVPEYKYIPLHQKPTPSVDKIKKVMSLLRSIIFPGFFGEEQEIKRSPCLIISVFI